VTGEQLQKAKRLIAGAGIGGVRLVEASAKVRFRESDEVPAGSKVSVSTGTQVKEAPREDGTFFVLAMADVKLLKPEVKGEPFLAVKAVFEVTYRLPEGLKASREELEAFAAVNGVFNAWPYFREYVQTTTARMNVTPIVLPLFKLPKPSKQQKQISRKGRRRIGGGG
jgi:hypothetical protein